MAGEETRTPPQPRLVIISSSHDRRFPVDLFPRSKPTAWLRENPLTRDQTESTAGLWRILRLGRDEVAAPPPPDEELASRQQARDRKDPATRSHWGFATEKLIKKKTEKTKNDGTEG